MSNATAAPGEAVMPLTPQDVDALFERSKLDHEIIVGSEVRMLCSALRSAWQERDEARQRFDSEIGKCAGHRHNALLAVRAVLRAFAGAPGATLNVTAEQADVAQRAQEWIDSFGRDDSLFESALQRRLAAAEARIAEVEGALREWVEAEDAYDGTAFAPLAVVDAAERRFIAAKEAARRALASLPAGGKKLTHAATAGIGADAPTALPARCDGEGSR